MVSLSEKRIKVQNVADYVGKEVCICGWLADRRVVGHLMFLVVEDSSGKVQVTIKKNENRELFNYALKIPKQSAIKVIGYVNRYEDTLEVIPTRVYVLSPAIHPLPLDPTGRVPASLSVLIQNRPLALRIPRIRSNFILRSLVKELIREFFRERGYIEVDTPKIILAGAEGGANLFEVKYFDKVAYLAQSPQLYKEQLTMAFDGVFEIAQYFRAERFHTKRHLTEFTSVDLEVSYANYIDVMDILEELIKYILVEVRKRGSEIFKILNYAPPTPPTKIPRITYEEAIKTIRELGGDIKWGMDIDGANLHKLAKVYNGFYFIIDWPWETKPFYIMRKNGLSESFDLMYGDLELASGGTREHRYQELVKNILDKGLKVESFEHHIKFYKYGLPPHSGFGLGLDRLMLILTGCNNIREVVLYPRDPETLTP
ncbi:MAG: aspartate--tRNA(Asn) ligase [Candidatus Geothermarchaeota archaeon]